MVSNVCKRLGKSEAEYGAYIRNKYAPVLANVNNQKGAWRQHVELICKTEMELMQSNIVVEKAFNELLEFSEKIFKQMCYCYTHRSTHKPEGYFSTVKQLFAYIERIPMNNQAVAQELAADIMREINYIYGVSTTLSYRFESYLSERQVVFIDTQKSLQSEVCAGVGNSA